MKHYTQTVAGDDCQIFQPERRDELGGFFDFLAQGDKVLGFDTETTGLDIYAPDFEVRLAQFGNTREAWVLRTDLFRDAITKALRQPRHFTAHNASFDALVADRHLGAPLEELSGRLHDTRILAHLLDPRSEAEGGAGLSLKPLSAIYVDEDAPDTQKDLNEVFRSLTGPDGKRLTKETGWRHIPIDHPTYVRYAGLDPILAVRLFYELAPIVRDLGLSDLSKFEHHLAGLLAAMQRKGFRVDVDYTHKLRDDLAREADESRKLAARYGVENVNSTAQIAEALAAMGEDLTERTPSGNVKVDKAVMLPLADMDNGWNRIGAREPNPLADAVLHAKRADKWNTAYVDAFLNLRDSDDRLHASIGGLQARTARMSISRPPLQQLPSGDWKVRRALVADPGHVIVASDYDQVEMRVLAALADVKEMKRAIAAGEDLHSFTARLVYGDNFTPFQRKLMKGVGFGKIYGGGAATLARQTGAPIEAVKSAVAEYDRVFPEIKRYGARLQSRAEYGKRETVTVSGRHLPLDRDRLYAATNYSIQSTSRDVIAQAIVDLFDAGLGDHLLLPVHDEIVAQAPEKDAAEVAHEIGRIMSGNFYGVPLTSTGEIYGPSWGHGYSIPEGHPAW